jgi:hypothetical protein
MVNKPFAIRFFKSIKSNSSIFGCPGNGSGFSKKGANIKIQIQVICIQSDFFELSIILKFKRKDGRIEGVNKF